MKYKIAIFAASLLAAASANASFGPLPGATFGGTGIPNDAVETTTITDGGNTITLGLTATPRNPPTVGELASSAGTFYAPAGLQWNFDFYANVSGGGNISAYNFVLGYALVPGTPTASLGTWLLDPTATTATTIQNSEYPGFGFLTTPVAGVIVPPTGPYAGPYNVNTYGDYQFVLDAYSKTTGALLGQSTIDVVVPETTTMAAGALLLLPFGLSTLRMLRKSRTA
jgi:hypothetical protein